MTLQDLIDRYNAKAAKPIKSWKQKRSILETKTAALYGETPAEAPAEAQPEVKEQVMAAKKKAVKKVAKKAAKKAVAKTNGSGVGAFVRDMVAKDKGTAEIFAAATAKGFETTYKSVASMVCRAKK